MHVLNRKYNSGAVFLKWGEKPCCGSNSELIEAESVLSFVLQKALAVSAII